ncbi:MAG: response regulator [Elusimicrobia bacterium]|nr:response regulator [Elusimicrobiota bacterium]
MENPEIIVVDDDPMVGQLSRDLLTDDGWKVLLIDDSRSAFAEIKRYMPKMVISDIMMPGITGLDICKLIKTDPETKKIKVIIVSGKSYEVEKQRAFQLGADYFLQKPYNVETFSKTVRSIMEGAAASQAPAPPSAPVKEEENILPNPVKPDEIIMTVHGLRGLPCKLTETPSKYGRQTMCLSLETDKNIFIFDAGTGIVDLGKDIVARKRYYKEIWLFMSHFHLDNAIGLPYFEPIHDPRFSIHIAGPNDPEKSLKEIIRSNFYSSFSPIRSAPKAKIDLYQVFEDSYEILPDFKITTMYANHPTSTLIYFADIRGLKIAYAPDSEIWGDATALQDYDERLAKFSSGSDVFIHDSYYNDSDYEKMAKRGHSSVSIAAEFAAKNEMKNFMLYNINPEYSDDQIDKMLEAAKSAVEKEKGNTQCLLAHEKKEYIFKINRT